MGLWSRVFGLSNKPKQDGPIAPPANSSQSEGHNPTSVPLPQWRPL